MDFAFVLNGRWHRLPESACEHAAMEVSVSSGACVSPLNYALAVALFLTALERHGWLVVPPNESDPMLCKHPQDERSTL